MRLGPVTRRVRDAESAAAAGERRAQREHQAKQSSSVSIRARIPAAGRKNHRRAAGTLRPPRIHRRAGQPTNVHAAQPVQYPRVRGEYRVGPGPTQRPADKGPGGTTMVAATRGQRSTAVRLSIHLKAQPTRRRRRRPHLPIVMRFAKGCLCARTGASYRRAGARCRVATRATLSQRFASTHRKGLNPPPGSVTPAKTSVPSWAAW